MRSRFRPLRAAVAAAMPLVLVSGDPATAAYADAMIVQGSGAISPGVSLIPTPQSISFGGTAVVVGTNGVLAVHSCSFSGTLVATVLGGTGSISGSCGPIPFDDCVVVAVVASWSIACQDAARAGAQGLECVFRVHQVFPTTSYDITCTGAAASGRE